MPYSFASVCTGCDHTLSYNSLRVSLIGCDVIAEMPPSVIGVDRGNPQRAKLPLGTGAPIDKMRLCRSSQLFARSVRTHFALDGRDFSRSFSSGRLATSCSLTAYACDSHHLAKRFRESRAQ